MNRQEAYEYLKDYLDNVFHNSNDYETYCYLRDCADTLAPPDPDPTTGLVPCGCGGKPRLYDAYDGLKVIQCRECGVCTLHIRPDNVQVIIDDWNAAMGYKGGDTHEEVTR